MNYEEEDESGAVHMFPYDLDMAILLRYTLHHESQWCNRDVTESLRDIARADPDARNRDIPRLDSAGRFAAIVNLYFDMGQPGGDEGVRTALKLYMKEFEHFLSETNVLDEQQWKAFYRAATSSSAESSGSLIKSVHRKIQHLSRPRPAFTLTPEFELHMLKLKNQFPLRVTKF